MTKTDLSQIRAVRPSPRTLAMRRSIPWQILRFLAINLQMTRMILKSHDQPVDRPKH